MTKFLAIDPGNVTGIAHYDTERPEAPLTGEIPGGLYGFVDWWRERLYEPYIDRVIVEDFIIDAKTHTKTREPAAYELVGWIKGHCHANGIPCMPIGAGEHTSFTEYKAKRKSKIVRLGWSAPSKDMHADSAQSILLIGLMRLEPVRAAELLKEIV